MAVKPSGNVHPAAALFPELAPDELVALADDIKENGLQNPIVLMPNGDLLEGRNRNNACKKVKVTPEYTVYEGDDPWGFVMSMNVHRRHLNTGQRAMALAIYLTETGQRENGRWRPGTVKNLSATIAESNAPGATSMRIAGYVLDHAPDLADPIMQGALALDAAYNQTRTMVEDAAGNEARLKALRLLDPELAKQVEEELLTLSDAEEEAKLRARIAKLPPDLAERVNSKRDKMTVDEAETLVIERDKRLAVWAEKIDTWIDGLASMAGSPVPEGLEERLDDRSKRLLPILLRSIARKEGS